MQIESIERDFEIKSIHLVLYLLGIGYCVTAFSFEIYEIIHIKKSIIISILKTYKLKKIFN